MGVLMARSELKPAGRFNGTEVKSAYEIGPVLIVSPWYRPNIGGIVEVADDLFSLLMSAGVEAHLLIIDHETSREVKPDLKNKNLWWAYVLPYVFDRVSVKTIIGFAIKGPVYLWRLGRFVRKQRFRSVILVYPTGNVWPFLFLQYILRFRLIVSLHGSDIRPYDNFGIFHRWLLRKLLRAASVITVCADYLVEQASRLAPSQAAIIKCIPNCVDVKEFYPRPSTYTRACQSPTFVHVSNFATLKRVEDIIEAFALFRAQQESRLIMVGDGIECERARKLAKGLHLDNCVVFAGVQNDIRSVLWESDVFVMASDLESCPIALLEAMACGLPFISTPKGLASTLPFGEYGILVANRSPKELADAMFILGQDKEECARKGQRARLWIEAHASQSHYLKSHLEVLSYPIFA